MIEYRSVRANEWNDAMSFVWRIFTQFNAPEYSKEGIENFYAFLTNPLLEDMFLEGTYITYAAFDDGEIVGFAGSRNRNFLSMLFVDENYHHQGIATALVDYMAENMRNTGCRVMQVKSSPYAVGFYMAYGFIATDLMQNNNGIKTLPMELKLC